MIPYPEVKEAVIRFVGLLAPKKHVPENYDPNGTKKYSAKTKLLDLDITASDLSSSVNDLNRMMENLAGKGKFKPVGPLDVPKKESIGDLIWLICVHTNTDIPLGEPK